MMTFFKVKFWGTVAMAVIVALALGVWQYLVWSHDVDVGLWELPVSIGLGIALGHMAFDAGWASFGYRREKHLARYQDMKISVEPREDGKLIAVAENENVFTTLELPEGYDPHEDGGKLMIDMFAREFGFLSK